MNDRDVVDTGVINSDDWGAFVSGTNLGCWKDGGGVEESDGLWGPSEVWAVSDICTGRRLVVAGRAVVETCTWKGAVALAASVTGVGITVHVAPTGAPVQVRVTGPAKPSMDCRLS